MPPRVVCMYICTQLYLYTHTCKHTHTHTVVGVTGLQIVIVIAADFRSDQLDNYVDCTADSLNINSSDLEGTNIPVGYHVL